jgi:hypothetical protein
LVKRYVERVLVAYAPHIRAAWNGPLHLCELSLEYASQASTSPAQLASSLLHEATHARLERLGFRYHPELRQRLEAICTRAEVAFAEVLPDGGTMLEELAATLQLDASFWSDAHLHEQRMTALRKLGMPGWLVAAADRMHRWRAV